MSAEDQKNSAGSRSDQVEECCGVGRQEPAPDHIVVETHGSGNTHMATTTCASPLVDNDHVSEYYTSPIENRGEPLEGEGNLEMTSSVTTNAGQRKPLSNSINNARGINIGNILPPTPGASRERRSSAEIATHIEYFKNIIKRDRDKPSPTEATKPIPSFMYATGASHQRNKNKNKVEPPAPRARQALPPFAEPEGGQARENEKKAKKRRTSAPARSDRAPVPPLSLPWSPAPRTTVPTSLDASARHDEPQVEKLEEPARGRAHEKEEMTRKRHKSAPAKSDRAPAKCDGPPIEDMEKQKREMEEQKQTMETLQTRLAEVEEKRKKQAREMNGLQASLADMAEDNVELRTEIELLQSLQEDMEAQVLASEKRAQELTQHEIDMINARKLREDELKKSWDAEKKSLEQEVDKLQSDLEASREASVKKDKTINELLTKLQESEAENFAERMANLKASSVFSTSGVTGVQMIPESQLQATIDANKSQISLYSNKLASVERELEQEKESRKSDSREWARRYEDKIRHYDALRKEHERLGRNSRKLYEETHGHKLVFRLEKELRMAKEKAREWKVEFRAEKERKEQLRDEQERLGKLMRVMMVRIEDLQTREVKTTGKEELDTGEDFENLQQELNTLRRQLKALRSENNGLLREIGELQRRDTHFVPRCPAQQARPSLPVSAARTPGSQHPGPDVSLYQQAPVAGGRNRRS